MSKNQNSYSDTISQTVSLMTSNSAQIERAEFSVRLQKSLAMNGYAPDSPTILAREFNIRFSGKPITVHAGRKWLVAEALPTQEKLRLLADWLGVGVQWLRYGDEEDQPGKAKVSDINQLSRKEIAMLHALRLLNTSDVELIHQMIFRLSNSKNIKAA
jgi:hypothetical protein